MRDRETVDVGEEGQGSLYLPFVLESVDPSCAGDSLWGPGRQGTALEGRRQDARVLIPLAPDWLCDRALASPGLHPSLSPPHPFQHCLWDLLSLVRLLPQSPL